MNLIKRSIQFFSFSLIPMKSIVHDPMPYADVSAIIDALPDLVYLVDREGIIRNVNSVFASWFGVAAEECIGESIFGLLSDKLQQPELALHQKRQIEEVLKTGKRKVFEDERDTWRVTINPVCSETNGILSLLVTIQDISTLRKTSKDLDAEMSLKTALLDTMPCSAVILDADLRMIVWNRYAEEMLFGNGRPDRRSVKPAKFFCAEDMAMLREKIMEVIHSGVEDSMVLKVHPHGKEGELWMLTRTSRILIDGKPCVLSIGIDITERKRAEEELSRSKTRLDLALSAAKAGVWEWNLKTGENFWSAETWPLYGLDWRNGEKPTFKLWSSTIHPDDREKTVKAVTKASKTKSELNAEYRVEHSDGSVHWLMSRGRPLYNNHGKVDRYIGTVIDITSRKKIEEELQRNREKLDFILKKSHVGVWDMNLQNYHVERSPEHAHIFGYDSAQTEWSLDKFFSHIVPEDRTRIQSLIMDSIHSQENYTFECRIYRPNGELRWIWVCGTCQSDINDNSMHVLGIVQDITEQKKAEAAVRANESKFRTIFDHSPVAIGIGEVEKGILYDVNNAMLELFGFDREEVIGRSIFDLGIVMNRADEEQIRRELYGCRKIINTPFHFRNKSEEALNILFSAEYISINDRQALLVMMTDITLREVQQMSIERLEQAVDERTGQLNEEVNRLNSFLSMITHEYRTPLAIIRGNLDLIELKNKRYNCINPVETGKIHRAIDRLVELMEESIHESLVFESRTQMTFKAFRISLAVAAQLESFRSLWTDVMVTYTDELGECRMSGDATQFGLAIYNLLDNARKYSPAGSPLELECRHADNEAVIRIRNQGKPITEEQAEAFFEKYRRGSNSMNTGGAGLGLWLVKNIVEQHKGTVTLKGIPSGVEATVCVPLYEKAS
jgi:PAS domain S-box-containing protein